MNGLWIDLLMTGAAFAAMVGICAFESWSA